MRLDRGALVVLSALLTLLTSSAAIASDDAPPALPTEYWGNVTVDGAPAADSMAVIGYIAGVSYGSMPGGTTNGYYSIILAGGDKPLTYNNDQNCSTHYAAGQACVPCANTSDCIEGPQDSATILIKVDGSTAMPSLSWLNGTTTLQNLIVITTGVYNYTLNLVPGWNLISIPIQPFDDKWSTILAGCEYNKIWEFELDQSWFNTEVGLEKVNISHGYYVDRQGKSGNCSQLIEGIKQNITIMPVASAWTLVGYPCIVSQPISTIDASLWDKIWEFMPDQSWYNTEVGLSAFAPGKGFWIDGTTGGSYNVTC